MSTSMKSFVSVPIETDQFVALVHFLNGYGSGEDPVRVIASAIDYWMENADWKEDLLPKKAADGGYRWKEVFLPDGARLRMKYRNEYHYAEVIGDSVMWNGKPSSPSQFANELTRSSRNAWRDLEVKRPGFSRWEPAQALRTKALEGDR